MHTWQYLKLQVLLNLQSFNFTCCEQIYIISVRSRMSKLRRMFHVKRHTSLYHSKATVQCELLHTKTLSAVCNSENTNVKICHKAFSKLKFKPGCPPGSEFKLPVWCGLSQKSLPEFHWRPVTNNIYSPHNLPDVWKKLSLLTKKSVPFPTNWWNKLSFSHTKKKNPTYN